MNARVINVADYPKGLPPNAIRVGRPSPWGNPFAITSRRTRAEAIALFKEYAVKRLRVEPRWLEPLKGKLLACHCEPLACHAEVLIELGA